MGAVTAVKVPDIGDFKDIPIIEIMVKVGDSVKPEDPLVSLESDKATMEVPSPVDGVVKEIKVKVGDKVSEGSLLLTVDADAAPAGVGPAQKIKEGAHSIEQGVGVRAISGEKTGFAYSDDIRAEALLESANAARASAFPRRATRWSNSASLWAGAGALALVTRKSCMFSSEYTALRPCGAASCGRPVGGEAAHPASNRQAVKKGNGQRAARHEVILNVDQDQCSFHHYISKLNPCLTK